MLRSPCAAGGFKYVQVDLHVVKKYPVYILPCGLDVNRELQHRSSYMQIAFTPLLQPNFGGALHTLLSYQYCHFIFAFLRPVSSFCSSAFVLFVCSQWTEGGASGASGRRVPQTVRCGGAGSAPSLHPEPAAKTARDSTSNL